MPPGLQLAQACHALREFAAVHPEADAAWHKGPNNLVVLWFKNEPELMLMQSGIRETPVGEVKQRSLAGDSAELEVSGTGGPQRVAMVREGGRWVVDLSATLQAKP